MCTPGCRIKRGSNRDHLINRLNLARKQNCQHPTTAVAINGHLPRAVLSNQRVQRGRHRIEHGCSPASMSPQDWLARGLARAPVVAGPTKIERGCVIQRHEFQRQRSGRWVRGHRAAIQPCPAVSADIDMNPIQRPLLADKRLVCNHEMLKSRALLPPQISKPRR